MSIKDSHNKKVTFDKQDELEDRIDKLTLMMDKSAAMDNGSNRQFKPQIFKAREEDKVGN